MGKLRVNGMFWLASQPDNRVAGVLEFSRSSGGRLKLLGSFRVVDPLPGQSTTIGKERPEIVRILGMTDKTHLTLEGCLLTRETIDVFNTQDRMPTAEYAVSVILMGCQLSDGDPILVKAIRVHICNLENWVGSTGISRSIKHDESSRGVSQFGLECTPIAPNVVEKDSLSLELSYSYSARQDKAVKWSLRESCYLSVMFQDPPSLPDAFDAAGALSTPVSVGVDSASPITSFRIRVASGDADGDPNTGQWVTVYADALAMRRKCDGNSRTRHEMLYTFDDIGGLEGLSRWLTNDVRFRTVLEELLSYWHVRKPYIGNRIVGLSIGVEMLYGKRHQSRGKVNMKTAFDKLARDASPAFGTVVGNITSWVTEVTRMRHSAAHGSPQTDDERLYALSESVYLLIVLNLLLEVGVPTRVLRKVAQHRRWRNVSASIK